MAPPEQKIPGRNPLKHRADFQAALIKWYKDVGKDYPWRRTSDPYAILVSELMLQQTQVATVMEGQYFQRWMEAFPDVATLAKAEETEVLKMWEGLGYYSRARNLRKAAKHVVEALDGQFPDDPEAIQKLPGVGRYTAGAVASFAFEHSAALVDANVARVFSRLFDWSEEVDSTAGQKQLWKWAEELVPEAGAKAYNSALMELGQNVCKNVSPRCAACPVNRFCKCKDPSELPKKKPKTKTVRVDEHAILAFKKGRILLEQEKGSRRKGLWKLPERTKEEVKAAKLPRLLKMPYSITHHRVTLHVHEGLTKGDERPDEQWFDPGTLDDIAMPSPYRRALTTLLEGREFSLF